MLIISLTPYPTLQTAKILQSVDDDLTLIQYEFPHDDAVYRTACEKVVAAFWQSRTAGTKWTLYHRADGSDLDVDKEDPHRSRIAYDYLMADLAGETIAEIYADEQDDDLCGDLCADLGIQAGYRAADRRENHRRRTQFHKDIRAPRTQAELTAVVLRNVTAITRSEDCKKATTIRQREEADEARVKKLVNYRVHANEANWLDYGKYVHEVKDSMFTRICNSMVLDAVQEMVAVRVDNGRALDECTTEEVKDENIFDDREEIIFEKNNTNDEEKDEDA